jgi:processive 1,2-diacylglycerol beta-glucosyltransferase
MRVFIVYALAGAGHFRCAEAIYDFLKENHPQIHTELIDILRKSNIFFRFFYRWGYHFLVNQAIFLWQWAYQLTYFLPLRRFTRIIARIINRISTRNFSRFLTQENPDFIISTHFLSSEVTANLKSQAKIKSKIVSVITDFGIHPFWVCPGTDLYVVATGLTKELLVKEGVEDEVIKDLGIPVHPKFQRQYVKDELCKELGIDKNKFTILITTGSFGVGPIEAIVDALYKEVQILVVCANNRKLYRRLKNKSYSNVLLFGFVNNLQELMSVSALIITKPGGLSIAELLIKELVPIFIHPIPGQETTNARILEKYGIGVTAKDVGDVRKTVLDYKGHPEKLSQIKEKIKKIKKPDATEGLLNAVCQSGSGDTG